MVDFCFCLFVVFIVVCMCFVVVAVLFCKHVCFLLHFLCYDPPSSLEFPVFENMLMHLVKKHKA